MKRKIKYQINKKYIMKKIEIKYYNRKRKIEVYKLRTQLNSMLNYKKD